MNIDHLLYIVLFSQIMFLSYYYPRKMLMRIHTVFKNYPPGEFPKLYPESIEEYKKSAKRYQVINHLIMGLGFALIYWFYVTPRSGDWDQVIIFLYFMIQFMPNIALEIWTMKYHKAMRLLNQKQQKEAVLQPRRITDFVSKEFLVTAAVIYFIFVGFIAYVDQFDYPWFGGYVNVLIVSVAYIFLGALIYRAMYGKVKNPHQSYEDRKMDIQLLTRQFLMIAIALTLYVVLQISLQAFGLGAFEAIIISLYFQVLGFITMQWPHLDSINFEVYKEEAALTN